MINFLKKIVENIPFSIGSKLVFVPFKYRLGTAYTDFVKEQIIYDNLNQKEKESFVVNRFAKIFEYAKSNFPFYEELYKKHNVYNLKILTFEDIKKVPIISKQDLRPFVDNFEGALKINTGGTSGEPFSFYVDKNAFAREWSHMHAIWAKKGYSQKDLKITLRGKDLGNKNIQYNPVHNEFIINTYKSVVSFKEEFFRLIYKRNIKYIHGYPSAIYNFLKDLDTVITAEEKEFFKSKIKACFLGSEFPTPIIKKYLSNIWELDYISWYGHSEMCVLAHDELKINTYVPYNTYGYTEVSGNKLIGTSYYNLDMPLIRYDTGDIVSAKYYDSGMLENFTITQGREGEFIFDNEGNKIPLTALIFGRHHRAFDLVDFIQVKQDDETKEVIFFLVSKNEKLLNDRELLNLDNINLDFEIKHITKPYITKAGKVKLKIE